MSFQLVTQAYAASSWSGECIGTGAAADVVTIGGIRCLIANLLSPLPGIIALAAVAMVILAGIRLMSAGAEPKAVASAWKMFTFAIVGLILLAVVWLALVLVENFTGAEVTKFGLPN